MDLTKYENAKAALAELVAVEDVREFHNKAVAVEAYARQAKDYQLERDAAIARVRAERRCGELLREMEKSKGGIPPKVVPISEQAQAHDVFTLSNGKPKANRSKVRPKTLIEMGISRVQSSKWQRLAKVPEEIFDSVISDPVIRVTGAQILKAAKPESDPSQMTDLTAQWLLGRLISMGRKNIFAKPVQEYINAVPTGLKPEAEQIIQKLKKWVNE